MVFSGSRALLEERLRRHDRKEEQPKHCGRWQGGRTGSRVASGGRRMLWRRNQQEEVPSLRPTGQESFVVSSGSRSLLEETLRHHDQQEEQPQHCGRHGAEGQAGGEDMLWRCVWREKETLVLHLAEGSSCVIFNRRRLQCPELPMGGKIMTLRPAGGEAPRLQQEEALVSQTLGKLGPVRECSCIGTNRKRFRHHDRQEEKPLASQGVQGGSSVATDRRRKLQRHNLP